MENSFFPKILNILWDSTFIFNKNSSPSSIQWLREQKKTTTTKYLYEFSFDFNSLCVIFRAIQLTKKKKHIYIFLFLQWNTTFMHKILSKTIYFQLLRWLFVVVVVAIMYMKYSNTISNCRWKHLVFSTKYIYASKLHTGSKENKNKNTTISYLFSIYFE